jgi:hypothetical protein
MSRANDQKSYPKLDYDQYARTLPTDDLWGQVKRTVAGNPVDSSQIAMIIDAIRAGLQLAVGMARYRASFLIRVGSFWVLIFRSI